MHPNGRITEVVHSTVSGSIFLNFIPSNPSQRKYAARTAPSYIAPQPGNIIAFHLDKGTPNFGTSGA
jgi:hypothetical protein